MSSEAPVAMRAHVFHVDLHEAPPGHEYKVIAPHYEQTLTAHTEESRQRLSASCGTRVHSAVRAQLEAATHYTSSAVMMPTARAYRVHVKAVPEDPAQPSWVYAAAMCIPKSDLAENESADEAINWVTTAQTFLFHHPDLQTPDPQVAAIVKEHLSADTHPSNYQLIDQLALQMRIAGPPTTDPNKGWATLVPVTAEGVAVTDEGETLYMQQPTPFIQERAGDAITAVMNSTSNDIRLKDKKWMLTPGVSTESSSANVPQLADVIRAGAAGNDWKATVDHVNTVHGMKVSVTVLDQARRQVRIRFENTYLRFLGAYIQFLDADMKPMPTPQWSPDNASEFTRSAEQYDDFRALGSLEPITTFMAIPVGPPGRLDVRVTFPAGAVAAGIFGCGLVMTGRMDYPKANTYASMMTGVANLAIPALMLGFGIAAQAYKPLYDLLNDEAVIRFLIAYGLMYYGGIFTREAVVNRRMDWRAFASLGQLIFSQAMKRILAWVTANLIGGTIKNAMPFAGWVVVAMNTAAGLKQMAMTIQHTGSSPWAIPNRLATTIDSKVTILPDPRARVFPQPPAGSRASCTVKMIFQANRPTVTNTITDIRGTSLNASFSNQLGGRVKFEANFYIGTWLAATASTGYLANNPENAANIRLVLLQNPVPLHDKSVYLHSQILTYQNDAYQWTTSAKAPASTIAHTERTGNGISAWRRLALNQRHAYLGWAWRAEGLGIPSTSGMRGLPLFAMQTMDIPGMPISRAWFPSAGFDAATHVVGDPYPPKFQLVDGKPVPDPKDVDLGSYWVDPRKAALDTDAGGGYHLRKIDGSFNTAPGQPSYGRFPWAPDSLVLHPTGHAVAVSADAKIMVLQLSGTGKADDAVPLAQTFAGRGTDFEGSGRRPGLLVNPVAVTCTYDGTILILEWLSRPGVKVARIQAFDLNGNPVDAFVDAAGKPSPFLQVDPSPTYLDITCSGNQDLAYIHLLSYENQGRNPGDYNMAIYQFGTNATKTNPLATTNALSAARIVTDMWHSVYALNWEMTTDGRGNPAGPRQGHGAGPAGRTVPSISLWMPPVPKP